MLIDLFPPSYSGHTLQVFRLANYLQKNHEAKVSFLTPRYDTDLPIKETVDGFETVRFPVANIKRFGTVVYAFSALIFFLLYYRRASLIHYHCLVKPLIISAFLIRLLTRKPTVGTMTLVGSDDFRTVKVRYGSGIKQYLRGTNLISISNRLTSIYFEEGGEERLIHQIPIGVDTSLFSPPSKEEKTILRQRFGLPANSIIILFTGVIIERKGVDVCIKTGIMLCNKFPTLTLLLAGPYDWKDPKFRVDEGFVAKMIDLVENAGLRNRIRFLGEVKNIEIYMKMSDLYIFTSKNEGLPNVLLEYSATGLSGVAAQLVGITSMVIEDGQSGFIVPGYDPSDYCDKLSTLVVDGELRAKMGRRAREIAQEKFSLEQIARQHFLLYSSLLDRNER